MTVERLRAAHRLAGLGGWQTAGPDGLALHLSPEACEMAGWEPGRERRFADFVQLVHPDDRARFLDVRAAALAGTVPYRIALRIVRPDGAVRHLRLVAEVEPGGSDGPVRVTGVVQDRTDEVEDLRRLRASEGERRSLLERVIDAEEIERRRLARHLAGDPIEDLGRVAERLAAHVDVGVAPGWSDALDAVHRAIASLHDLVSAMATEAEARDLAEVIDGVVGDVVPDMEVTIDLAADLGLRPSLQATVARIVQEALLNVRKHARASSAAVRLEVVDDGGTLAVVVADDGRGFDLDTAVDRPGHLGLVSMRERVEALGGGLGIESEPGHTVVQARLPLR